MRFLFWNLGRRDRIELLGLVATARNVDVIAIAECPVTPKSVVDQLDSQYRLPESYSSRLQVFSRFPEKQFREVWSDELGRMSVRSARLGFGEILLAIVHLPSKRNWESDDQAVEATVHAERLRQLEREAGHERTLVVGDLNMHPFETGIVQSTGFHGMMARSSVQSAFRTVQGREYPLFYNPMWGLLGDRSPGPPGTYYYRHSGHVAYDWHMFDQVLIRPALLPRFQYVEVVTESPSGSLINEHGHPDANVGSDHLPILFDFDFDLEQ